MRRILALLVAVALVAAACSSGDGGSAPSDEPGDAASGPVGGDTFAPAPDAGACDDIDEAACLLPWPNDRFTRADESAVTGRRVDLPAEGMPTTVDGVSIDPAEWNRNDGYAPVSQLIAVVPGLDPEASGLPPVTDIGAGSDNLLVYDVTAGEAVPVWAELDANAPDPETAPLLIVPATALAEGHTFVVGLKGLVTADGTSAEGSEGFQAQVTDPDVLAQATFEALAEQGFATEDLDLAWSFTVGSADSIAGRLQHMWTETAAEVGDGSPPFTVTSVSDEGTVRTVEGTIEMPKYLTDDGGPGTVLANDDDPEGLPSAEGTMEAPFTCLVPAGASADDPSPFVLYGHGLLGSRSEVEGIGGVGASAGIGFCALDEIGMSSADVPAIVDAFADLTGFRTVPDRLQQGALSFLLLGRALASDEGFGTDPAFQDGDGGSLIDTETLALLGASQGGIQGGVSSSLTTDWDRVILAVPGIGYNLLLRRSIDFDEFLPALEAAYPDPVDQSMLPDLLEQLWQRGENAGYAQHLTDDPYDGTEASAVLLLEAFGDHQVANVSTEKLARTLGLGVRQPALAEGRSTDVEPLWGLEPLELPSSEGGLVVWDFGTPAPPVENVPNRGGDDPHGKLADVPEALALVLAFVTEGQVIDVCDAAPCESPG